MLMKMLLPSKTTSMSFPHGHGADTTEDNDNQDANGDGEDCDHGDGILDRKSDGRSEDATSIVNKEKVGSLIWPFHTLY